MTNQGVLVRASAYADTDFQLLPTVCKAVYWQLCAQRDIDHCGVFLLNESALLQGDPTLPPEVLREAIDVLLERRFLVRGGLEWMVRTWMRNTGIALQPNLVRAAVKDAQAVRAPIIATTLADEFRLLRPLIVSPKQLDSLLELVDGVMDRLEYIATAHHPMASHNPTVEPIAGLLTPTVHGMGHGEPRSESESESETLRSGITHLGGARARELTHAERADCAVSDPVYARTQTSDTLTVRDDPPHENSPEPPPADAGAPNLLEDPGFDPAPGPDWRELAGVDGYELGAAGDPGDDGPSDAGVAGADDAAVATGDDDGDPGSEWDDVADADWLAENTYATGDPEPDDAADAERDDPGEPADAVPGDAVPDEPAGGDGSSGAAADADPIHCPLGGDCPDGCPRTAEHCQHTRPADGDALPAPDAMTAAATAATTDAEAPDNLPIPHTDPDSQPGYRDPVYKYGYTADFTEEHMAATGHVIEGELVGPTPRHEWFSTMPKVLADNREVWRYCDQHMPDGDPADAPCVPCKRQRAKREMFLRRADSTLRGRINDAERAWKEARQKYLDRARREKDHADDMRVREAQMAVDQLAVANCELCNDEGLVLLADGSEPWRKCDHIDHRAAASRGRESVQAALDAAKKARAKK